MSEGLAASLYKKIPVNMRIFGESLLGSSAPITEADFTPRDLQFIKESFLKKKAENAEDEAYFRNRLKEGNYSSMILNANGDLVDNSAQEENRIRRAVKSFDDTRGKTSLGYNDYGGSNTPQNAGWFEQVKASFGDDPAQRIGTTLGQFNVHEGPDGDLVVKDRYDWEGSDASALEKVSAFVQSLSKPEELGNVLMRTFSPNVSRNVNIRLPRDTK